MGKVLIIRGADFSANAVAQVNIDETKVSIAALANISSAGVVTGSGDYEPNTNVSISASANTGFVFVKWSDGNTSASRSINSGNYSRAYIANFIESEFKMALYSENSGLDSQKNSGTPMSSVIVSDSYRNVFRAKVNNLGQTYSYSGMIDPTSHTRSYIVIADANNNFIDNIAVGAGWEPDPIAISGSIDLSLYPTAQYIYLSTSDASTINFTSQQS